MIFIELIADFICGILDALGGYHWLFARRYIMPFICALMACLASQTWWLGLTMLPAMGTLTIGYPFNGNNFGRGLWLFVQAAVFGAGACFTGHLMLDLWFIHLHGLMIYVPYVILAGLLGGIYKNWKQTVGDMVTGTYLCSIILFIHPIKAVVHP